MSKKKRTRGLGRGLSTLLGETDTVEQVESPNRDKAPLTLPVTMIEPNPYQPRRRFEPDALEDLIQSIREKGILQPLLVRPLREGCYQIVAGERRWRAAQAVGLEDVPVLIRDFDDSAVLESALIENIQRHDLNPVEEATGYQDLIQDYGHTQESVARLVGKSRAHITNMVRLLKLPSPVQDFLREGLLNAGHARALVVAPDPESLAHLVVKKGLNVRQTEKLARVAQARLSQKPKTSPAHNQIDVDTRALAHDLSTHLGFNVKIQHKGKTGMMEIHYENLEQLDDLCRRLSSY